MSNIVNEQEVANYFLSKIGAPTDNADLTKMVASWFRQESGAIIVRNNPANLTFFTGEPGFAGMEGAFSVFDSLTSGIDATAYGLELFAASDFRGYAQIVQAARDGNAQYFAQCLAQSAWDAGRYGTIAGGPNHILTVFDNFGAYRDWVVEPGPLGPAFESPVPAPTPTPEPTPAPAPVPSEPTYTVVSGDTLWDIAAAHLGDATRWGEIASLNGIPGPEYIIHPGDVLKLPNDGQGNVTPPVTPTHPIYVVQPGDNLSALAERFLGNPNRWVDIYNANREVIGGNPNLIHPGQRLTIP